MLHDFVPGVSPLLDGAVMPSSGQGAPSLGDLHGHRDSFFGGLSPATHSFDRFIDSAFGIDHASQPADAFSAFALSSAPKQGLASLSTTAASSFSPSSFSIDPAHLSTAVSQISSAIVNGYAAADAIALLQKASAKASVSDDDMLVLTETKLKATSGSAAAKAVKAFDAEMVSHLSTGKDATDLAALVSGHHLTASVAAGIVVSEAKIATPTPAKEAHAVAVLLNALAAKHVASAQIAAIAKTDSALIVSGVAQQVSLGGSSKPTTVDLTAASDVYEAGLKAYSATAFATLDKEFAALEKTAAGRTALNTIETAALKAAVAGKLITQATANQWDAAFDGAETKRAISDVLIAAASYATGKIDDTVALQDLKALAPTNASADALLLAAAKTNLTSAEIRELAQLTRTAELFGNIDLAGAKKILAQLLSDVTAVASGKALDASTLAAVLDGALYFGALTEANAIKAITKAAATAGAANVDTWLLSMIEKLGDPTTIENGGVGTKKLFLAIANVMAARETSGAFETELAKLYATGKISVGSADALIHAYAPYAIANVGIGSSTSFTAGNAVIGSQTQDDGVTADDRTGFAVATFMKDVEKSASASLRKSAENYIYMSDTDMMLLGLGIDAGMQGDVGVAGNIEMANDVITMAGMSSVTAAEASAGGGNNPAAYSAAMQYSDQSASLFSDGLMMFYNASKMSSGAGFNSIATVADIVQNPGDFQNFSKLAANVLDLSKLPDNPLAVEGAVADLANLLLKNTGLGDLLGPVGGVLEGAAGVVSTISGGINEVLNNFATSAVDTAVMAGMTLVHVAEHFGSLVGDLFTGNLDGLSADANALVTDLGNDIAAIGNQIANSIVGTAEDLYKDAVSIVNTIGDGVQAVGDFVVGTVDAVADAFCTAFTDVGDLY